MKTFHELSPVLQIVWALIFLLALCGVCAAVTLLHLKYSQWWECSWCHHWFNGLRMRRKTRPKFYQGIHSHGICPHCFKTKKAEILQLNLNHKQEFYPRMNFDGESREDLPTA